MIVIYSDFNIIENGDSSLQFYLMVFLQKGFALMGTEVGYFLCHGTTLLLLYRGGCVEGSNLEKQV